MASHQYYDYHQQPSIDDDAHMSNADHEEAGEDTGKGGTGTGFLFGNIDRKGRLDEEYLSDEAKDNLDNIGTKVTDKNEELDEIREALPGDKNSTEPVYGASFQYPSQSPSQLPQQQQKSAPDDDFEDSDGEFYDEEERAEFAKRALTAGAAAQKPSKAADDDEDYDEDEDDNDGNDQSSAPKLTPLAAIPFRTAPAQAVSQPTATQPPPLPTIPKPTADTSESDAQQVVKPPSTISPPKPTAPILDSKRITSEEDAVKLQQALFENAKQQSALGPSSQPTEKIHRDADDPVLFSELFARKPPRLNFSRPPRHTYGVKPASADLPPPCANDSDRLFQTASQVEVDPISKALEADAKNRELLFPSEPEISPRVLKIQSCPEYEQASAPLQPVDEGAPADKPSVTQTDVGGGGGDDVRVDVEKSVSAEVESEGEEGVESNIAPFEIMSWEDDIMWKAADEKEDEPESKWLTDEVIEAAKKSAQALASQNAMSIDVDGDDDSDDDDEFEEPQELNLAVLPPQPAAANSNDDDDDDDDMEWEDGDAGVSDSADMNGNTSAQTSNAKSGSGPGSSSQGLMSSQADNEVRSISPKLSNNKVNDQSKDSSSKTQAKSTASNSENKTAKTNENDKDNNALSVSDRRGRPHGSDEGKELIQKVLEPNRDLASGNWVHGIVWNSDCESDPYDDSDCESDSSLSRRTRHRLSRLILDMNDPNMVFEHLSEQPEDLNIPFEREQPTQDVTMNKDQLISIMSTSGAPLYQTLQADPFNVSNDVYYATGTHQHSNVVGRGPSMRRLQDAPPAIKIQTAPSFLPEEDLLSYRRPKLRAKDLPRNMTIQPLRRKRIKGGQAQVAGQIPKRKVELRCSEKDTYRVTLFEYAIERQPCLLPIPGMASRIKSYARKESSEEVNRADQTATGTTNSETVFMGPDEPPPLACGNIEAGEKPLSVVESQLFVAPCAKHEPASTDFLLIRHGKNMYVREIDSLVSVGLTEPKVDVMNPNTERYKKYGRERVYLWVMREFQRMRKDIDKRKKSKGLDDESKNVRNPPYLEKEEVFNRFPRRRTYPETSLNRALKDFGKFQNGSYNQNEEVVPQYGTKEQEMMRVLTPIETAAFESMESGWTHLFDRGIYHLTHPSGQGNILAAAEVERCGLDYGVAVGKYIKSLLLKSPWYRSAHILAAHRSQRKDLLQALALARIVNDLKEGGEVMEAKLQTLTATDMSNVLTAVFKYNSKKIPGVLEERRSLIRELCQKKGKGAPSSEMTDYPTIIRNVLKRHRDAGLSKGASIAAAGTSMAGGTFLGIPLPVQRRALEEGDVSELPAEEDDFVPDENAEKYIVEFEKAKAKSGNDSPQIPTKKGRPMSSASTNKSSQSDGNGDSDGKRMSILDLTKPLPGSNGLGGGGGGDRSNREKSGPTKKISSSNDQSTSGVKISIDMKKLEKAGLKKKSGITSSDKPKSKKSDGKSDGNGVGGPSSSLGGGSVSSARDDDGKNAGKKPNEKKGQQIGKIKINAKQLNKDREQAALKRKRSQYSEDIDYRAKKASKTSRKKRNGTVELNGILERIENTVRMTEAYVDPSVRTTLQIVRLRPGESPPVNVTAKKLANPSGTGLDFTAPVDIKKVPYYKEIIKKPMYLNLIRTNCKQMKYKKSSEFLKDMELIFTNARAFNREPTVQWVVQHAELLYEVAAEEVSKHADEIKMAEDMVAMEEIEARAAGGASKKAKKSKNKSTGGPGSDKKKKKLVKDTITIPDGDDEVTEVPMTSAGAGPSTLPNSDLPGAGNSPSAGASSSGIGLIDNDMVLNIDD